MSNFLLRDPDCVLIHIPKTGGSTIRNGLWNGRYIGPAFGAIPDEWKEQFKFAFVRNPLDRLVSAWADFSGSRGFDATIDEFVDIVVDDSVIYDERRQTLAERIRHHTIPQTHPFNCLSSADFVARFENYSEDLNEVLTRVGLACEHLPQLRKTNRGSWKCHLQGDALRRVVEFFAADFELLGYRRP